MALQRNKKWTKKEEDFVVEYYGDLTAKVIGQKLGRTESSVRWKASELGLTGLNRITATAVYNNSPLPVLESSKPWWKFW